MEASTIAHSGKGAERNGAVDWQPEQVQSGLDSGESGGAAAGSVVARGLGWFSIGLGLAQLLVPDRVVRLVGAPASSTARTVTRVMGIREIAHGAGLLSSTNPGRWAWSRVAGDLLDLTLLGRSVGAKGSNPARLTGAAAAVVGTTAADVFGSINVAGRAEPLAVSMPMRVRAAVTIRRDIDDVYRYWREFDNLPDIMTHLQSVELLGDGRSRWTARMPLGTSAHWDAQVVEERPGELIRWESLPGSGIDNSGEVRLAPAPRDMGTELRLELHYDAPAGPVAAALLKLFGDDPVQQVKDDLRRFKQVMETGQVVRSDGAPTGTDARLQPKQHPAQPAAH